MSEVLAFLAFLAVLYGIGHVIGLCLCFLLDVRDALRDRE